MALTIITVAIVGFVLFNNARNNAEALETRQDALDEYTGGLRTLLQTLTPPTSDMQKVLPTAKSGALDKLPADSKSWVKQLQKASTRVVAIAPPTEIQTAGQLFSESVQLYLTAARTFRSAASLDEGDQQRELIARASEVRDRASSVWTAGVSLLDDARADAELDPSSLRVPTSPTG